MDECRDDLHHGVFNAMETVVRECVARQFRSGRHRASHREEIFSRTHESCFELLRERRITGRAWVRCVRDDCNGNIQLSSVVRRRGRQHRSGAALHDRGREDDAIRSVG